ncbi:MAG TPA: twitch domain-containing radical SAM protein [Elusimicrobiota bacterium]|nr:twitch domain-containing radical SAM protein [Elusimicrobiota bacterium]
MPADPAVRRAYEDWDVLLRQLEPLLEEGLEEIVFAGGEALVMDEHYRVLDFLLQNGLCGVRLHYITNFSTLHFKGRDVLDAWSRFKSVKVAASLDGSGRRGEYLRKGLNWDAVVSNREEMLKRCPGIEFNVSTTLSAFNALHLPDFHREWTRRGYIGRNDFVINLLLDPEEQCAQVLPPAMKRRVVAAYRRHRAAFARSGRAAQEFAAAERFMEARDESRLLPRFVESTRRLDALRGENCPEVFPELAALFD